MPRFAANLTTMFPEVKLAERFALAAGCGFHYVELLSPYDHAPETVAGWLEETGLQLVLINIFPGNEGEMGTASLPGREDDFHTSFEQALTYAKHLQVPMIHVLAGRESDNASPCEDLFIENIRTAADLAASAGINIMLEPINTRDVPGYLHSRCRETARLIGMIGRENVGLQFDCYHQQIMEGDLCQLIGNHLEHIGHVQFSSLPGRNEPQYGEVNLPYIFEFLDRIGYDGWIGCEYRPRADTVAGLSWAKPWGIHPPRAG